MLTQIRLDNHHRMCRGTLPMNLRQDHVRELQFHVPKFKSPPTVSATIHSSDSTGNGMVIWNIEKRIIDDDYVITISAQSADSTHTPFTYLCDLIVIGEVV